jgi:hypothetical protein
MEDEAEDREVLGVVVRGAEMAGHWRVRAHPDVPEVLSKTVSQTAAGLPDVKGITGEASDAIHQVFGRAGEVVVDREGEVYIL